MVTWRITPEVVRLSKITKLSDGRIEVIFNSPLETSSRNTCLQLILLIGWARGSEVLVKNGKIVDIRCYPFVWEDVKLHLKNKAL
jgi:hypothetical protein